MIGTLRPGVGVTPGWKAIGVGRLGRRGVGCTASPSQHVVPSPRKPADNQKMKFTCPPIPENRKMRAELQADHERCFIPSCTDGGIILFGRTNLSLAVT